MSQTKKHNNKKINTGFVLLGIQVFASLLFIFFLLRLSLVPTPILLLVGVILLLTVLFVLLSLMKKKRGKKSKKTVTKVISVILSIVLFVGSFYLFKTGDVLSKILGSDYETHSVLVYVMKDSSYNRITDLEGKKFGVVSKYDQKNIDTAVEKINKELDSEANLTSYDSYQALTDALYNGEIDAMIMNEAFSAIAIEHTTTFQDDTKVVFVSEISEQVKKRGGEIDVTKDTFTVYISGIDTYGSVSTVSRSDVNMLMTINPQTHQILLTNIPRDYYVTLHTYQALDKLTHAGIYGVNESMDTLEDLLNIDIDYYLRVNFSSLVNIVDAVGGITVDNPRAFLDFPEKKDLYLDGTSALRFSRERYSFSEGDRERGRNQQRVIMGIIDKVLSPSIITNYTSILNAVSGSFQTSISTSDLSRLVKMQFANNTGWDIQTYSLDGTGAEDVTYSYGSEPLYVMVPDQTTVTKASQYIEAMENGQRITVEQ